MDDYEAAAFIKEKEDKLGRKIRYRTYCTWYAKLGSEIREYGVFLYSDGEYFHYEDFNRTPAILGIPIKSAEKKDYVKLEGSFPVDDIESVTQVTWSSANASAQTDRDISKTPSALTKAVKRLATKIVLRDGTVIFIEPFSHKELIQTIKSFKEDR